MSKARKVSPKEVKWQLLPYRFINLNAAMALLLKRSRSIKASVTLSYGSPLGPGCDQASLPKEDVRYKATVTRLKPKGVMTPK